MTSGHARAFGGRALAAGLSSVMMAAGGAVTAPFAGTAQAATPCQASQITRIWDGGTSSDRRCAHVPDRLDHLFYPGYQTTRATHSSTYRENTVFIQLRLRDLGYRPIAVDGHFGSQTAQRVTSFQRYARIVVDGKVGPQTWQRLFGLGRA